MKKSLKVTGNFACHSEEAIARKLFLFCSVRQ